MFSQASVRLSTGGGGGAQPSYSLFPRSLVPGSFGGGCPSPGQGFYPCPGWGGGVGVPQSWRGECTPVQRTPIPARTGWGTTMVRTEQDGAPPPPPTSSQDWGTHPPQGQNSYTAGGMPFAVTQEDFLFFNHIVSVFFKLSFLSSALHTHLCTYIFPCSTESAKCVINCKALFTRTELILSFSTATYGVTNIWAEIRDEWVPDQFFPN